MLYKGQRVEVIGCADGDSPIGARGTVIEDAEAPWVRMDRKEDTTYALQKRDADCPDGWEEGYMNCFAEDELKVLDE